MLPRRHRVTAAQDFRKVTRTGVRAGGSVVVMSALLNTASDAGPRWRCGFIVSKAVGNAVVRHRTQRRLRHLIWTSMQERPLDIPAGTRLDLVVRALPGAASADHDELSVEMGSALARAVKKARRSHVEQ